jgi:hypothetical protein
MKQIKFRGRECFVTEKRPSPTDFMSYTTLYVRHDDDDWTKPIEVSFAPVVVNYLCTLRFRRLNALEVTEILNGKEYDSLTEEEVSEIMEALCDEETESPDLEEIQAAEKLWKSVYEEKVERMIVEYLMGVKQPPVRGDINER